MRKSLLLLAVVALSLCAAVSAFAYDYPDPNNYWHDGGTLLPDGTRVHGNGHFNPIFIQDVKVWDYTGAIDQIGGHERNLTNHRGMYPQWAGGEGDMGWMGAKMAYHYNALYPGDTAPRRGTWVHEEVASPTDPVQLEFYLGGLYPLSECWIWQWQRSYGSASPEIYIRGCQDVTVKYKESNLDNWTTLGTYKFGHTGGYNSNAYGAYSVNNLFGNTSAATDPNDLPQHRPLKFNDVQARYVQFEVLTNWGDSTYTALSETRFYLSGPAFLTLPEHREDQDGRPGRYVTDSRTGAVRQQVLTHGTVEVGGYRPVSYSALNVGAPLSQVLIQSVDTSQLPADTFKTVSTIAPGTNIPGPPAGSTTEMTLATIAAEPTDNFGTVLGDIHFTRHDLFGDHDSTISIMVNTLYGQPGYIKGVAATARSAYQDWDYIPSYGPWRMTKIINHNGPTVFYMAEPAGEVNGARNATMVRNYGWLSGYFGWRVDKANEWCMFDMGKARQLDEILVWGTVSNHCAKDVRLEVSNDGQTWSVPAGAPGVGADGWVQFTMPTRWDHTPDSVAMGGLTTRYVRFWHLSPDTTPPGESNYGNGTYLGLNQVRLYQGSAAATPILEAVGRPTGGDGTYDYNGNGALDAGDTIYQWGLPRIILWNQEYPFAPETIPISVGNVGGGTLSISSITIEDDAEGQFALAAYTPKSYSAGTTEAIGVTWTPPPTYKPTTTAKVKVVATAGTDTIKAFIGLQATQTRYAPGFIKHTGITALSEQELNNSSWDDSNAVDGYRIIEGALGIGSKDARTYRASSDSWLDNIRQDVSPAPQPLENHWIQFDLGAEYNLDEMWVWNHNQGVRDNPGAALNESLVGYKRLETDTWTTLPQVKFYAYCPSEGEHPANPPASNQWGTRDPIQFPGTPVRYVLISAAGPIGQPDQLAVGNVFPYLPIGDAAGQWGQMTGGNYGSYYYWGLNEVRFYEAAPESRVSPSSVDFGVVATGQTVDVEVDVFNSGKLALNITSIAIDGPGPFDVTPTTLNVPAGTTGTVTVTCAPADVGDVGVFMDTELALTGPDSADAVPLIARVFEAGNPDLEVTSPSGDTLPFGTVAVGLRLGAVVKIRNHGDTALTLSGSMTGANAAEFTAPSGTVEPGGIGEFTVSILATSPGAKTATLILATNDPDMSSVSITCTATAIEAPPASSGTEWISYY